MKILAVGKDIKTMDFETNPEKMQKILNEEFIHFWEGYKYDFVREFYFRTDNKGVVLILEANSVEEAEIEINKLPLVKEGYVEFELIPLGYFRPFENLIPKE
ncbi:hypothetical protein J2127_001615 [Methanococcus voltae]|uniref:hypothetical protein n=1 Tax=Methanococcus voltae TaxID=2188 RepID=UPI001AEA0938|nr:hypothetical protein [Methanococcus voltae]MBP2144432.1 hypothetical protein [Methanococcus voltae]